jgi:hypothetical protein
MPIGGRGDVSAVWMRLRSEIRTRWRSWLGLALLIGLAGGAAVAAAAGARRTETAYPRFVQAQNGYDLITGGFPGKINPGRALAQLEAMPEVAQWAGWTWPHPRPSCRPAGWCRHRNLWPSPT